MQAQQQFTPEQMIVAGRRAEGQGQPAYALQFYRYIADHFPSTTEAFEARDAIYRLTQPVDPAQAYAQPGQQPQSASPQQSMTDVRPSLDAGAGPSHGRPLKRKAAEGRRRQAAAEDGGNQDTPGPAYRIGRFVAMMLGTMGWLMLLGVLLMVPLSIVALTVKTLPKGLRDTIAGNLLAVGGLTFGMLFLGLFAIFAAQVARATFDTADAVRHMMSGAQLSQDDDA